MKTLFDQVSSSCAKLTTQSYSTSFSLGIYFLNHQLREPIRAIYGFVRLADEIVDSFQAYNQELLLREFRQDTLEAIERKISLNPILNSFQNCVNSFNIEWELIDTFLKSMEMDLERRTHDKESFKQYILGSAEVVGLMCLRVFTDGNIAVYQQLKAPAMALGSAFQKINFLRDLKADYCLLSRSYFPNVDFENFNYQQKLELERDIQNDFAFGLSGIKLLPRRARLGVYIAYVYYQALLRKIAAVAPERVMQERIRVSTREKVYLLIQSYFRYQFNFLQ